LLAQALTDPDAIVLKNALRIAAEGSPMEAAKQIGLLKKLVRDPDARVQLNALIALGSLGPGLPRQEALAVAETVVAMWPDLKDRYRQSAAIGCASADPVLFAEAAFRSRVAGASNARP